MYIIIASGDNGTIDGQGSVWWNLFSTDSLNYSRPHIIELVGSDNITISNLTFLNSPAWSIHPIYCRYKWFIFVIVNLFINWECTILYVSSFVQCMQQCSNS